MKKLHWMAIACLIAASYHTSIDAQVFEMSTDVVQEGDGEAMRIMSFSTSDGFDMTGPAIMMASPGMDGSFSFGGDQFGLLGRSDVQGALDLVPEQVERFKEVQKKFNERMSDVTKQMRSGGRLNLDGEMIEKLKQVSKEIKDEKREEIEGLLLPGQLERLKQVALQMKMKQQGTINALRGKEIAEALGLDEDQIESLREKSKEISARMQEEMEALREKARKDLLSELTSDQQKKLEELMGEDFEESKPEPGRRFNMRRDR